MPRVLEGISVLDFTQGMPGSVATMVLSDFGAEVIKVEPPGGDPFRAFPASLQWNRGKKSIILDPNKPSEQTTAQRLADTADVVVESFRPGVAERLGIGYQELRARRPDLVYASLTGFGPKGPYAHYKGYEAVVAAKSGRMTLFTGQVRREGPVFAAVNVASHAAALAAARGIVAALYVRDRTGHGQKVETSLLQAITPYDLYSWIVWQMMVQGREEFPEDPQTNPDRLPPLAYLPARTKDGQWLQLANLMEHLFRRSLHSIGLGDVLKDPRFATAPRLTEENRELLRSMMLSRIQERTLDAWMDLFLHQATDVAAEPFTTAHEAMRHSQVLHNGHVQEVADPRVGPMSQIGPLLLMSETPGAIQGPAPEPGQDGEEVRKRLEKNITKTRPGLSMPAPSHPLEGITLLDLSTVIAGPMGASLMAELGARVIHVEPLAGDWMRNNQPLGVGAQRTMGGTENLSLDLRTPEGREIVHSLVAQADAVVHNMRPGVPQRLGIDYPQLRGINPRLVYLYIGGYGATGPYSQRPSMHPIPGAVMGGALTQAGRGIPPPPETPLTPEEVAEISRVLGRSNDPNPDPNTAMIVATGLMLGLYARERFGIAQELQVNMLGANAYANLEDFFDYPGRSARPLPDTQGYGLNALYRLYQAQQGWIFLACPFDQEWQALCQALGRRDLLEDTRFATAAARSQNDDALAAELEVVFATRPARVWEEQLTATDVACVQAEERRVYHFFAEDPHVRENGFTVPVSSPLLGNHWRFSPLIDFSVTPGKVGPSPPRGQHTRAILQELGYTQERIRELREQQVIDWEEK